MWECLECGRKFRSCHAAEKAAFEGCPGCGGVDIDVAALRLRLPERPTRFEREVFEQRAVDEELRRTIQLTADEMAELCNFEELL